jgi:hypothetical protein
MRFQFMDLSQKEEIIFNATLIDEKYIWIIELKSTRV